MKQKFWIMLLCAAVVLSGAVGYLLGFGVGSTVAQETPEEALVPVAMPVKPQETEPPAPVGIQPDPLPPDPGYVYERPEGIPAPGPAVDPVEGKVAYLTFDDGPTSMTPQILDVLQKKGVKATFFAVYKPDKSLEIYYESILRSGSELAIHAYEHDYKKIYQSADAYLSDYETMQNYLLPWTGRPVTQVRFPGGSSQSVTDREIFGEILDAADKAGITYHDWNVSSGDASPKAHSAAWVYHNVMDHALRYDRPVILMHDIPRNTYTLEALPFIIDALRAEGYSFDTVSNIPKPVHHKDPPCWKQAEQEETCRQPSNSSAKPLE